MVTVLDIPIPVTTECGDGYILYIKSNGFLENDEFAVVLLDGGNVKHFASDQVKVWNNATYGIKKKINEKEASQETTEGSSSNDPNAKE